MKEVKNISNNKLHLVGIGTVEAGETIKVPQDFNNANFELVKKEGGRNQLQDNKKNNAEISE